MFRLILIASCAVNLIGNVDAQGLDGNHFLKTCAAAIKQASNDPSLTAEEAFVGISCISYVSGFVDGLALAVGSDKSKRLICLPEQNIPNEQKIRIFVKYLNANPEKLHESGRMSLLIALARAFPCK